MSVTFNKMCNYLDPSCNESAPNKTSYQNLAHDVHVFIFWFNFFSNNRPLFGKDLDLSMNIFVEVKIVLIDHDRPDRKKILGPY